MFLFIFRYQLSDGQTREETGVLKLIGDNPVYVVTGFYSFKGTDGITRNVSYKADENGFQVLSTKESSETEIIVDDRIDPTVIKTLLGR